MLRMCSRNGDLPGRYIAVVFCGNGCAAWPGWLFVKSAQASRRIVRAEIIVSPASPRRPLASPQELAGIEALRRYYNLLICCRNHSKGQPAAVAFMNNSACEGSRNWKLTLALRRVSSKLWVEMAAMLRNGGKRWRRRPARPSADGWWLR